MTYDEQRRQPLTAAEIGLFLNMTTGAVRKLISLHSIDAVDKRGRAYRYWTHEVFKAAGNKERRYHPRRRAV